MFNSESGATFMLASWAGICQGTFEILPQDMVDMGISTKTLWSPPLLNVTWHSWTSSIDSDISLNRDLVTKLDLITVFDVTTVFREVSIGHLHRVSLANRGRLLLRTPGPVAYGTWICSDVETIHSWTCHVYEPFEFRTSLGTSILLGIYDTFRFH